MEENIVKEKYFIDHYSHVNNIDPTSDESVNMWLKMTLQGSEREIGAFIYELQQKKFWNLVVE